MFNLPVYPDVYNTRHIICVSCKEKFSVTEGHRAKRPTKNPEDNHWRVLSNEATRISLRQEDNRQQRPIVPQPLQMPRGEERSASADFYRQPPADFTPYPINCPRCGADNRNWLSLNQTKKINFWKKWWVRSPNIFFGLGLALIMGILGLLLPSKFGFSSIQATVMLFYIPIVTYALIHELSDKWEKLRIDIHTAKILPNSPRVEIELWRNSIFFLVLAAIIIPALLFSAAPIAYQKTVEFLTGSPEEEITDSAEQVTTIFNDRLDQTIENIDAIGEEMEDTFANLPDGNLPQIEQQLERVTDKLDDTAAAAANEITAVAQESIPRIEAQLDNDLSTLEATRESEVNRLTEEIMANVRALSVWAASIALPLIAVMMTVIPAIKAFAAKVDRDLPPPLFYSVNNMTRLVTWEARQALEIDGKHHSRIQWMSVDRNETGGLDLVGLFRDPPHFDASGQVKGELVRAQKHTIHTDRWGRVIDAKIEDLMVPIPAGAPAGVMQLPVQSHHDAPADVRVTVIPPER
ncbi:MAG: hypothetical protein GY805_06385 [Chloroflexi bacterium]|nr:hypothetical protein [Chloroflexota bacterium]